MGLFSKKQKSTPAESSEVVLDDGTAIMISASIDCIGDSCPRPQLMTRAAIEKSHPGETIEVKTDNPTSMEAIPPMMPELGASHVGTIRKDRYWQVLVRKN